MESMITLEYKGNNSLYNKRSGAPNYGLQLSKIPYHGIIKKGKNLEKNFSGVTLIGMLVMSFRVQTRVLSCKEIK